MEPLVSPHRLLQDLPAPRPSLRLAVVTETWPPEVNGVALTLSRLVQGQCDRHHHVQLVRPRQTPSDGSANHASIEEVLVRGMPIPRYPHLKLGLPGKKALIAAWAMRRPDLVHIATEGPLGWSALQAARQLRLPVTSDFRTNFHRYSEYYGLGWLKQPIVSYLRTFHNQTQCTMVPTRALAAELASQGFENTRVVARGVDTQMFRPDRRSDALRASWGADATSLVALVVGRLAAEKNLELAIQAFAAMRSRCPSARLVFVGDGPLGPSLRRRCPQAVFAGQLTQHALAACYASADLCLFPSATETFGNVTLEALSSGLPVLAFDTAAAAEWLVHDEMGWVAPMGDAQAYVDCARGLAERPERLAWAAARARERVLPLDWRQIAAQVEAVFLGVMAQHAGCARSARPLPAF